jgi:hypothetical protein
MMSCTASAFVAAVVLAIPLSTAAQEQTSRGRPGWPCGGRLDPSYLDASEATGGHLLMLAPSEVDGGLLLAALDQHPETIFRLAGPMNPGVHEFRIPIDPSVESVVFSISVQCLQTADIARPSGAPLVAGEGVTDLSNFRAVRTVIVNRPEAGVWTMRAAGTGVSIVMVKARSALAIGDVEFAAVGSAAFTPLPLPGVENVVRFAITGGATEVRASIVNAAFRRIAALTRIAGAPEDYLLYVARFTPGSQRFRVMIEGKTDGVPFQRVHAPLFILAR